VVRIHLSVSPSHCSSKAVEELDDNIEGVFGLAVAVKKAVAGYEL
jgi:hypothetical protein